jgi:beta-1,3-galactosyltransferase 1
VYPNVISTILEPRNICQSNIEEIFLLIIVTSSPQNFLERHTIRETWGNTSQENYQIYQKFNEPFIEKFLTKNWHVLVDLMFKKFTVKIAFIVGLTDQEDVQARINRESEMYGDLIQENFQDSYNNLTLKSLFLLKWVKNNCLGRGGFESPRSFFQYFYKCFF